MRATIGAVIPTIRGIQARYGVAPLKVGAGMIRLVSPEAWQTCESLPDGVNGCWNNRDGIIFLKYDPASAERSRGYAVWRAYEVTHELAHAAQAGTGIQKTSFHLNEGCTDRIAKEAFEIALPVILTIQEKIYVDAVAKEGLVELDGLSVPAEYMLSGSPLYSRIVEMELIRELEKRDPLIASHLLHCAFHGETDEAERILGRVVNKTEMNLLRTVDVSPRSVLDTLRKAAW